MDTIQAAKNILSGAAESLNKLIESAVAEQRYDEVKQLADLADGVARILREETAQKPRPSHMDEVPSVRRAPFPPPKKKIARRSSKSSQYPWFGRNADRLVKVGWSKKNKKEYEHRVPKEAVMTFIHHLADQVTNGCVFDVESLLPVTDESGQEVPSYQVYVTLAWLREMNVIKKKGRDGYVLPSKDQLRDTFDELWNSLRTRES